MASIAPRTSAGSGSVTRRASHLTPRARSMAARAGPPPLRDGENRAHFHRAVLGTRNSRRDLDGVVQILRLHQVKAAELLLRLGERAVSRRHFAVAHAERRRGGRRLEGLATEQVAALFDVLGECHVFGKHGVVLFLGRLRPLRFFTVDEAQVLHGIPPRGWLSWCSYRMVGK